MSSKLISRWQLHQKRIRRLSIEGCWVIVSQIITFSASIILVRVITERLVPDQYGQLALMLAMAGIANQVIFGGITAAIGRYYSIAVEKNNLNNYLIASIKLLSFGTVILVAMGGAFVCGQNFMGYEHMNVIAASTVALSLLTGWKTAFNAIQNAARHREMVALNGVLDALLKIGFAVGVVALLGPFSSSVLIGYVVSTLLVIAVQIFSLRNEIGKKQKIYENHNEYGQKLWKYSIPVSVWGTIMGIQQVSDRWALEYFASTYDVGQYAVLYQLGFTPIAIFTSATMGFLAPILYQRTGDGRDLSRNSNVHMICWRIIYVILVGAVVAFLLAHLFGESLLRVAVAKEYQDCAYLLPWFVLAGGFFSAGQFLNLKLEAELRPKAMVRSKVMVSLLGVILNMVGAKFFGITGVTAGLLFFSILYFYAMARLGSRCSIG